MGRNRFKEILQNIHINDNSKMPKPGETGYDKLYKVRPLINSLQHNSQKAYNLHRELSVDEAMVLFKGRSSLKQYMPLKPVKKGYKVWRLCDATNGYAYNFQVYTGATSGAKPVDNLGSKVVKTMIEPIK